jgi:hypothetical protein
VHVSGLSGRRGHPRRRLLIRRFPVRIRGGAPDTCRSTGVVPEIRSRRRPAIAPTTPYTAPPRGVAATHGPPRLVCRRPELDLSGSSPRAGPPGRRTTHTDRHDSVGRHPRAAPQRSSPDRDRHIIASGVIERVSPSDTPVTGRLDGLTIENPQRRNRDTLRRRSSDYLHSSFRPSGEVALSKRSNVLR